MAAAQNGRDAQEPQEKEVKGETKEKSPQDRPEGGAEALILGRFRQSLCRRVSIQFSGRRTAVS